MMTISTPRMTIPDEWAAHTRCPVCDQSTLRVHREPGKPDSMKCPVCETRFNIEDGGSRIWLEQLPPLLHAILGKRWVSMAETRDAVKKITEMNRPTDGNNPPPDAPPVIQSAVQKLDSRPRNSKAIVAEAVAHASELLALGNTQGQVRQILRRSHGLTPKQIDEVMGELVHRKAKQPNRYAWISSVLILIIIALIAAIVIYSGLGQKIFSGLGGGSSSGPGIALPASIQTAIAPGTNLIKGPEPTVQLGDDANAPIYPCPQNADEAERIFGGTAKFWSYADGWTLMSDSPTTVYVPKGRSAAYPVVGSGPKMKFVDGPATIYNVYVVMIGCRK